MRRSWMWYLKRSSRWTYYWWI